MWASGAAYEPYVGRWSRLVAREFVAWLGAPPGQHWLDVGCGTGALADAILASPPPAPFAASTPRPTISPSPANTCATRAPASSRATPPAYRTLPAPSTAWSAG